MNRVGRSALLFGVLALALGCGTSPSPNASPMNPRADAIPWGAGFLAGKAPKGAKIAVDQEGRRAEPRVTEEFQGIPTSNEWWSSLIWKYSPESTHSLPLHAHPLVVQAEAGGLGVGAPQKPEVKKREYMFRYEKDLLVGLDGLASPGTRVAAYSDWTVTADWNDELRMTFGHGLPFVYGESKGTRPIVVRTAKSAAIFHRSTNSVGLRVGDRAYGIFGPRGSSWRDDDGTFRLENAKKSVFAVAVLPDASEPTLRLFEAHAFRFVRDTKVSWRLDEKTSRLVSRFQVETEFVDDCADSTGCRDAGVPLLALYRHQWLNSHAPTSAEGYASPRGRMKLLGANEFTTEMTIGSVLPALPLVDGHSRGTIENLIDRVLDAPDLFPVGLGEKPDHDAYWEGKSLGKLSNLVHLADQLELTEAKERLLTAVRARLEDWFDGRAPRFFYYDTVWRSVMGFPDSYGSATQINDHHFHYGYFVMAAATVARFDPEWAVRYRDTVDSLVQDAANWKRDDSRFPFLRYMDPYAGHSWANGPAQFADGNNEEASSEDLNFSAATLLWGAVTGRPEIRDLGAFLYANQVAAVEQYWFDVDDAVFPAEYRHPTAAMVWGAGAKYDTWFDQDPTVIHGINFLPFTGASLYLGRRPEYVQKNFDVLLERSHGDITTWRDYVLMFLASGNAALARTHFERDPHFEPEFGNSLAFTLHWLEAWEELGRLDTQVTADVLTHATFTKNGQRRHVAFNPDATPRVVRFSDGASLDVPPRSLVRD